MGHGHHHHHGHSHGTLTQRAALASVSVAIILIVVKAAAWMMSGSVAMLSSLADSSLDLVASAVTLFAVRYAQRPPDEEHRFGHGKAEAFAGLFQATLVFASAVLVGHEAITRLNAPKAIEHSGMAVAVMALSMLLTGALVSYQGYVKGKTKSVAISGDRMHYITDLASNAVAMLGIAVAAVFGWLWADAVAGLMVALWLGWGAISVLREGASHLMDTDMSVADRKRVIAILRDDPRVSGVHDLRTRASGPHIHMQCHMDLPAEMTLEEAHKVMVAAEQRLLKVFPNADLLIHPDPRGKAEPHGVGVFHETTDHDMPKS